MPCSSWSLVAVSLTSALLSTGCAVGIHAGNPRPNVDVPESASSLALELDPAVRDTFQTSGDSGIPLDVQAWRTTLERGFTNSFGSAVKTDGEKALVLQLVEADLVLVPSVLPSITGTVAAGAEVRYKARLVDAQGNVVRRSVGTVASRRSTTNHSEVMRVVDSAVEGMYEKIAEDLFYTQAMASCPEP